MSKSDVILFIASQSILSLLLLAVFIASVVFFVRRFRELRLEEQELDRELALVEGEQKSPIPAQKDTAVPVLRKKSSRIHA
ncbi:MAG: hypothetical protein ORN98_02045 [Alphaproteobacteria bacterium]|nr:hypothetical protein [Alphaproteobacteria bacterium]